jgi:hypothetical protein
VITKVEEGHYYRYIGPSSLLYTHSVLRLNNSILDGKPHRCIDGQSDSMGRSNHDEYWCRLDGMHAGAGRWPLCYEGVLPEHWVECSNSDQLELEFTYDN